MNLVDTDTQIRYCSLGPLCGSTAYLPRVYGGLAVPFNGVGRFSLKRRYPACGAEQLQHTMYAKDIVFSYGT